MPAWIAFFALKIPLHGMIFARFNKFPDSKIRNIALFGVEINAGAGAKVVEVESGKIGIGSKFTGIKINAIGGFIGVSTLN